MELQLKTEYVGNHEYGRLAEPPDTISPVSVWELFGMRKTNYILYKLV